MINLFIFVGGYLNVQYEINPDSIYGSMLF